MEEWSWPQRARPQRRKAGGGKVKGVHWFSLDKEEVVRGSVNKDAMQVRHNGREPVKKNTVKTRIDFTGKAIGGVTRAESQWRWPRGQGAGWSRSGEQTRTSVTRSQHRRGEPEHTGSDREGEGEA